jgi:hypothetical protein
MPLIAFTGHNQIIFWAVMPCQRLGNSASQTINAVAIFAENRYIQTHYQAIGSDRLIILQKPNANTGRTQA